MQKNNLNSDFPYTFLCPIEKKMEEFSRECVISKSMG